MDSFVRKNPINSMEVHFMAEEYLRLYQIVGDKKRGVPPIIPVARSTWLQWVKDGKAPAPLKHLGKRVTVWRKSDVLALAEGEGK